MTGTVQTFPNSTESCHWSVCMLLRLCIALRPGVHWHLWASRVSKRCCRRHGWFEALEEAHPRRYIYILSLSRCLHHFDCRHMFTHLIDTFLKPFWDLFETSFSISIHVDKEWIPFWDLFETFSRPFWDLVFNIDTCRRRAKTFLIPFWYLFETFVVDMHLTSWWRDTHVETHNFAQLLVDTSLYTQSCTRHLHHLCCRPFGDLVFNIDTCRQRVKTFLKPFWDLFETFLRPFFLLTCIWGLTWRPSFGLTCIWGLTWRPIFDMCCKQVLL